MRDYGHFSRHHRYVILHFLVEEIQACISGGRQ